MYANVSLLSRKFSKCSVKVKCFLFKTHCSSLYWELCLIVPKQHQTRRVKNAIVKIMAYHRTPPCASQV